MINVSDIKMFVKSMCKVEWRDWFLTILSKYTKSSVMQNSLVLKLLLLLMWVSLSLSFSLLIPFEYRYHFTFNGMLLFFIIFI